MFLRGGECSKKGKASPHPILNWALRDPRSNEHGTLVVVKAASHWRRGDVGPQLPGQSLAQLWVTTAGPEIEC